MSKYRCFFCFKRGETDDSNFEFVESCKVPASEKPLQVVLQHLANCINTKLVFQSSACICDECLREVVDYDNLMVNLLATQKKLTRRLHVMLNSKFESDDEGDVMEDIVLENVEEQQLTDADALNPDLDTKEEYIEIDETIEEDDTIEDVDENSDSDNSDYNPSPKRSQQECVVCGLTFKSKVLLQNHVTEVHNAKTYTCNICGAARRDEEYLELHMNIHEGKTEMECRYCPKRFSRPINTIRHMRKHWDKKKYQCEKCGERFSLDNMLYNHRLRHEAEENPLICSVCNQSFRSRKTFNHHMLIHQENRPRHHCPLCSKSFTERYTLKMHMNRHYEAGIIPPPPPETEHLEEENKETEAAVTALVVSDACCVICSIKFENKEALEQHLQQDHDVILK